MTAGKGVTLPSGHGEVYDDAHKLPGPFEMDGTAMARDAVVLNADEKTLNQASKTAIAVAGIVPYFDGTEVDWGGTAPSEDTPYPSGTKIPWIYDHGVVVGRAGTDMAENTQLGAGLSPATGGTWAGGGGSLNRAICADLLAPTGGSAKMAVRLI